MRQFTSSFLHVLLVCLFGFLPGCADRTNDDSDQNDALPNLIGLWQQVSGFEVESGCDVFHYYYAHGSFFFTNQKLTGKTETEELAGSYSSVKAGTRYKVSLQFLGENHTAGCSKSSSEVIGKTGGGYYEFRKGTNADGTESEFFDVYSSEKGSEFLMGFKKIDDLF